MLSTIHNLKVRTAAAAVSFFSATSALANGVTDIGDIPDVGQGNIDIRDAVLNILGAILNLMALAAVVVIVVAGIRLIIGGQDEGQREKAKNTIVYAIIGLIVILLSSAIVNFVANNLG